MAYIRISLGEQEIERRDLSEPVVIGRAPECQIFIRDILLSRRHIRLEPAGGGWIVRDLGSKNGTMINDDPLTDMAVLRDGDVIRLGRVRVTYCLGKLAGIGLRPTRTAPQRPADPMEALSGTICGFRMLEPGESQTQEDMPLPRPEPRRPAAFERDDVYSLLSTIASSSWDSIYAEAQRPLLDRRKEPGIDAPRPRRRPRSPIDLSLQVCAATDTKRPARHRPWHDVALTRSRRRVRQVKDQPNDPIRRRLPIAVAAFWAMVYLALALKGSGGNAGLMVRPVSARAMAESLSVADPLQERYSRLMETTAAPREKASAGPVSDSQRIAVEILTATTPMLAGAL
ncbi:MAG TPA: FHA domain-containing protein [Tepidisphaeraceae bacterium]|nr:FHA domain-containing protein [Tepidisphaeraceae bacterium]